MPVFGAASKVELATCDDRLQQLANEAIKYVDFSIIDGHRGKAEQDKAYANGNSKTPWPLSKHNKIPSRAFDFAPYPVDWSDAFRARVRFYIVAGVILVCAKQLGIKVRFGWDWNRNQDPRDDKFQDSGHVELDEP